MYRKSQGLLLKQLNNYDKNIFSIKELALLWDISNKNTLYTTLKRYVEDDILYRIKNGVYSKKSLDKLHQFEIACAVAGSYSYISTETVLALEGIIMQSVYDITTIGKKTLKTTVGNHNITVRSLSEESLINRKGIYKKDNYYIATKERALADMQHYKRDYYFDNELSIDKKELKDINLAVYKNDSTF